MHVTLYFLVSSLLWIGSMADQCYQCAQTVHTGQQIMPASCAGGKFDNNNLPPGVTIRDCGPLGCFKGIGTAEALGYKGYTRSCGQSNHPANRENKCFDSSTYYSNTNQNNLMPSGEVCICHGDFCNGAARISSQAIIGVLVSVIGIIVMQY